MKNTILISLFILINFRILQQLYLRANDIQSSAVECDLACEQARVQLWQSNQSSPACNESFGSYCDMNSEKNDTLGYLGISSMSPSSDKGFFYEKRLIVESNDIYEKISDLGGSWKRSFTSYIEAFLSSSQGALQRVYSPSISEVITQLVLGREGGSEHSNSHLLKLTGTQHLFAISGFHLSFFVLLVNSLYAKFFSKSMVVLINIVVCLLYVCLVGNSPSLFRAFFMFFLSNIAWLVNRQKRALATLCITFIISIMIDIQSLYSIGFQLSYAATFGILIFVTQFSTTWQNTEVFLLQSPQVMMSFKQYLSTSFFISLAAQIAVSPLLVYHFQEISVMGLFATTVVAWTLPIILQLGFIFILAQLFVPIHLLSIVVVPLFFVVSVLLFILKLISFEFALIQFPQVSLFFTLFVYLGIILLYGTFHLLKKYRNIRNYEKKYHFCL